MRITSVGISVPGRDFLISIERTMAESRSHVDSSRNSQSAKAVSLDRIPFRITRSLFNGVFFSIEFSKFVG